MGPCRAAAAANGIPSSVFGDAALGLTDVVRCMLKWVYHPDDHSFNAIVSRIRVTIECICRAGQSICVSKLFQEQQDGQQEPSASIHCGCHFL
jgi:hypothetical protein